jgi:ubiquinol-cytochrome c reductase cytochrome c1 subunit
MRVFYLKILIIACFAFVSPLCLAEGPARPLDKMSVDISDSASLQRGAQLYMNYCSGCHSLKYVRYEGMAQDIGIVDSQAKVLEAAVKENLMFAGEKITDTMMIAMPVEDAQNWFGKPPPDLSLVARSRGANWLYTYLRSFYPDAKKPWGVNNYVFPDVGMPNVLSSLEKKLSQPEFDAAVRDLVNFLVLMGEPKQRERERLGVWVLIFLGVFMVFCWLLKREYWKDVH